MKKSSRILTCALALSLALHLVFAVVFRPVRTVDAHPEQTPLPIHITVIHTPPPPTPTPRPTVPPPAHPRPAAVAARPVNAPHIHHTVSRNAPSEPEPTSGPVTVPEPPSAPSAGPETPEPPTPTPKPACAVPNAAAATIDVVAPSLPASLTYVGDAQAQVRVTLDPSGAVESAQIYRTAGNPVLDREALRAARQSTYRAEIRDCVAVRGDYLFTVDFRD